MIQSTQQPKEQTPISDGRTLSKARAMLKRYVKANPQEDPRAVARRWMPQVHWLPLAKELSALS